MGSSKFWTVVSSMLRGLFGRTDPAADAASSDGIAAPAAIPVPVAAIETPAPAAGLAVTPARPGLMLAARLASVARLNPRKGRRAVVEGRRNSPVRAAAGKARRSVARPVWIGAERRARKPRPEIATIVQFRPKARPSHKPAQTRAAAVAVRRAA